MRFTTAVVFAVSVSIALSAFAADRPERKSEPAKTAVKTLTIGGNEKPATQPSAPAKVTAPKSITAQRASEPTVSRPAPAAITKTEPAKAESRVIALVRVESPAPAAAQNNVARIVGAKGSDFDVLPVVLNLSGDALEKYKEKLAQRNEGYDKWLAGPRGQEYTAAQRESGGMARRGPRFNGNARSSDKDKKFQELRAEQISVRRELRRELNRLFTFDQLKSWAGYMLYDSVVKRFAAGRLSDEQRQQAYVICAVLGAMNLTEGDVQRDPYLEPSSTLKDSAEAMIKTIVLGGEVRSYKSEK